MTRQIILTSRLKLVPSTQTLLGLEMDDMQEFAKLLGAFIAEDWPPGEYDRDAMQFFIDKLREGGADAEGWYGWYAIRQATQTEPATLIGAGGYLGPPDQTGTVELGYSISERWRGQGLAQEIVSALVDNALKSGATKIIAHTGSDNPVSIAVLRRCGFRPAPTTDSCRLRFDYYSSF
jgi:ribosomal-protein-alanine N-acetyltransferase